MRYHLALESIGHRGQRRHGLAGMLAEVAWRELRRASVRCEGQWVRGQIDYAKANSCGSRGVMIHYFLEPGTYWVAAPRSWTRTDHYTLIVHDDGTAERRVP